MNLKCTFALICLILSLSSFNLFASGTAGTSGADFLELGVGARPLGMGEAFTAETNDVHSIYYNPAGLGTMKYPMLAVQHQELIEDSRYENVLFAYPIKGGYLGVSHSLFWVPPFAKIDEYGNEEGKVQFYNGNLTTAYGYDFGFLSVGGSFKYIYQQIDTLFLHSVAVDVGILKGMYMFTPFDSPIRNFHIGLSIQNMGTAAKDDPLPRLIRMGFSYQMTHFFKFNVDLTENFINPSDLYDFTYGFDESFRVNTGMEIHYLELVALRAGYRFNDGGTYTLGFGFNYVVSTATFTVDTSYADAGLFGPTYSISVSVKLIPKVVTIDDKRDAETHYQRGIRYYVADEIKTALQEFKKCRDFNPYHKNIDKKIKDLEELLRLKEKNESLDKELKKIEEKLKKEKSDSSDITL